MGKYMVLVLKGVRDDTTLGKGVREDTPLGDTKGVQRNRCT